MNEFQFSVNEAAKILGCHGNSVRQWVARGILPDVRDSRGYRLFRLSDLLRLRTNLEQRGVRFRGEAGG